MLLVDVDRGRMEAALLAKDLKLQPETEGQSGTAENID